MTRTLLVSALALALLAAATVVALADVRDGAIGGGDVAPDARIGVADHGLGPMLVDGRGRTLYLWRGERGPRSSCLGACARAWPPETTRASVAAGAGVDGALLGLVRRPGGALQVTYAGHPLYRFSGDAASGQAGGQGREGFGAAWWVVGAGGAPIVGV